MDDSIEIHTPEEALGLKETKSRKFRRDDASQIEVEVRQTSHGGPFRRGTIASGLPVEVWWHVQDWDGHESASQTLQRWGLAPRRYSSNRGSPRHTLGWRCSPHRHSSDHRRPSSSSGRSCDRGREWSSTSSMATSTCSCHRDPTGQQGSSGRSRAENRDSGSMTHPAGSSLSRRETTSRTDMSGHPESLQQVRERGRRGSSDFLVSLSTPPRGASTTHQSRSSSSGENWETYCAHVSEVYRVSPTSRHGVMGGWPLSKKDQ